MIFGNAKIYSSNGHDIKGLPRDTGVAGIPLFQPILENSSISLRNNLICAYDKFPITCESDLQLNPDHQIGTSGPSIDTFHLSLMTYQSTLANNLQFKELYMGIGSQNIK